MRCAEPSRTEPSGGRTKRRGRRGEGGSKTELCCACCPARPRPQARLQGLGCARAHSLAGPSLNRSSSSLLAGGGLAGAGWLAAGRAAALRTRDSTALPGGSGAGAADKENGVERSVARSSWCWEDAAAAEEQRGRGGTPRCWCGSSDAMQELSQPHRNAHRHGPADVQRRWSRFVTAGPICRRAAAAARQPERVPVALTARLLISHVHLATTAPSCGAQCMESQIARSLVPVFYWPRMSSSKPNAAASRGSLLNPRPLKRTKGQPRCQPIHQSSKILLPRHIRVPQTFGLTKKVALYLC